ncbi:swr complex subunit [Diatrype stigma]|uniref:SWR1-complex protein 4 n=1 Tax=Diatrype stigma TaxID=117547 RepID=A0AAN9UUW7_9PEZI
MASSDVRDVLNLPAEGSGPRPTKKQRTAGPRPSLKGLAREVQNLGGDNPIAIVPEISTFKKRRFGSRKPAARWELRPFYNSAREDASLHLRHWRKRTELPSQQPQTQEGEAGAGDGEGVDKKPPEYEDSMFAKFNVKVDVPEYSDEQYRYNLTNNDWTKEETDYLFDLARDFDLRWPLIWDRYDYKQSLPIDGERDGAGSHTAIVPATKARSMEDLKARYYEVAAKMMAIQKPVQYMTPAEYTLHETMANFNPVSEAQRKKFAEGFMSRSKEEAREEEALLIEVRRILARTEKFNQERRDLYNRLDYPHTDQDISAFKSSTGLQTLLQTLMTQDKTKKRKSIMENAAASTPVTAQAPALPASTPVSESRRESIAASTTTAHRDSVGNSERPEKPTKKGAQQPERKQLSEVDKQVYGVSYHDRLGSGPTFRYERINKILTTKSHAQHQRITNTLAELDIPSRLNMPTKAVVEEMEKLLNSIGILLDMRKMNDKVEAEIKVERAKKAEREKHLAPPEPSSTVNKEEKPSEASKPQDDKQPESATTGVDDVVSSEDKSTAERQPNEQPTQTNEGDGGTASTMDIDSHGEQADVKQETADEKGERPTSRSGRKRSVSVMSSVSDKSAKRQKK